MITLEELHEAMEYYGIDCIKRTDTKPVKEGAGSLKSVTMDRITKLKMAEARYDIALIKKKYGEDAVRSAAEELFGKR
jgi:uncharacterized small protein (DUF1192 family)